MCSLPSLLREPWIRAKYEWRRESPTPRSRSPTLQACGHPWALTKPPSEQGHWPESPSCCGALAGVSNGL
ncbi:hypothetical protein MC885_001707 [Smutsia gigantea]|nr:hypothetical protein MC885_001707 [Smutsia gigantea]